LVSAYFFILRAKLLAKYPLVKTAPSGATRYYAAM